MTNANEYITSYQQFLFVEAYENNNLLLELNNICGSVNESSILLEEGKMDNLKNFVSRICNAIIETVQKFLAKVTKMVGLDQKFLTDNKEIILGKAPKSGTIINNWYNYRLDLLQNYHVPDLNLSEIENYPEKYKTKEEFINNYPNLFGNMSLPKDDNLSLVDKVKKAFRGNPSNIKSEDLKDKMAGMYSFMTTSYPALKEKLGGDISAIKKVNITINTMIKAAANKNTNVPNMEKQEAVNSIDDTLRLYFNEADDEAPSMENTEKKEEDKNTHDSTSSDNVDKTENKKGNATDACKFYMQIASDILSAKMNVLDEVYRIYMKFIRWHIDSYKDKSNTTQKETEKNKGTESKSTDFNADEINNNLDNLTK